MNYFFHHITWQNVSLVLTGLVALSAILEKLTKVKFLWSLIRKIGKGIGEWFMTPIRILRDIQHIKEQQLKDTATLLSLENEIKYNGGKYTLKTAVKEIREMVDTLLFNQELTKATLRASLYVCPDPIYIVDKDGRLTFVNAAYTRMVECTNPQELMGWGWLRVISEKNKNEMLEVVKMLKENPTPYSGKVTFKNWSTGADINTYCRSTVILDKDGKLVEMIGALEIIK